MTNSQRWRKSVAAIDFATALARLLRDGSLRDAFAADSIQWTRELDVSDEDFQALVSLSLAELEVQANVLLRKRFDEVRRLLPVTCSRIGKVAWSCFKEYARRHWPQQVPMALSDAQAFCIFLRVHNPQILCRSEENRVVFAGSDKTLQPVFGARSAEARANTFRHCFGPADTAGASWLSAFAFDRSRLSRHAHRGLPRLDTTDILCFDGIVVISPKCHADIAGSASRTDRDRLPPTDEPHGNMKPIQQMF